MKFHKKSITGSSQYNDATSHIYKYVHILRFVNKNIASSLLIISYGIRDAHAQWGRDINGIHGWIVWHKCPGRGLSIRKSYPVIMCHQFMWKVDQKWNQLYGHEVNWKNINMCFMLNLIIRCSIYVWGTTFSNCVTLIWPLKVKLIGHTWRQYICLE